MIGNWRNLDLEKRVMIEATKREGSRTYSVLSRTQLLTLAGKHTDGCFLCLKCSLMVLFSIGQL